MNSVVLQLLNRKGVAAKETGISGGGVGGAASGAAGAHAIHPATNATAAVIPHRIELISMPPMRGRRLSGNARRRKRRGVYDLRWTRITRRMHPPHAHAQGDTVGRMEKKARLLCSVK